jgi:hypothetical protein
MSGKILKPGMRQDGRKDIPDPGYFLMARAMSFISNGFMKSSRIPMPFALSSVMNSL